MKSFGLLFAFGVFFASACSQKGQTKTEVLTQTAALDYEFAYEAYAKGELIPALGAITRALEKSPGSVEANNLKGLILFRQEKFDQAETSFRKAIALDAKYTEAFLNLGAVLHAQEKFSEAIATFEKALENPLYLFPERIYNNMGLSYARLKQWEKARENFEQAIQLRPNQFVAYQNLGKLWLELGNAKKAQPLLEEATRLCRDCVEPRYHLGLIYLKNDQKEAALKLFREGAKLDPRGYFGDLCRQYLVSDQSKDL